MQSLIVLAAVFIMLSCNSSPEKSGGEISKNKYATLNKAAWLIGTWNNQLATDTVTETWQRQSDSSFVGASSFKGKGASSEERIVLTQTGGHLLYVPTVSNQNAGQPVTFNATSVSEKELVFENPAHDFPQKISYRQITDDSLVAEVSGMINGKMESQSFPMKKGN